MVSETESKASGKLARKRSVATRRYKTFDDIYMATGEQLGSGAFGQVQTYRDIAKGGEFAVKVINTMASSDADYQRSRILKEVGIYNLCKGHPNVVQIVQYFEEGPKFYIVFEKLGKDLWDCMFINGIPSENEVRVATKEIAQGLEFLHSKGIAHRDLKPQNILCDQSGGFSPLKICDFDLATDMFGPTTDQSYEPKSALGTAQFMSPEMVDCWRNGEKPYDAKCCDMWSLGVMMYLMFCGQYPFYGDLECKCSDATFLCAACKNSVFDKIECGQPTFEEEMWDYITVRASDLVENLLELYPHRRCTIGELLSNTWLNCPPEVDSNNDGDAPEILDVGHYSDVSSSPSPMDDPTSIELENLENNEGDSEVLSIPGDGTVPVEFENSERNDDALESSSNPSESPCAAEVENPRDSASNADESELIPRDNSDCPSFKDLNLSSIESEWSSILKDCSSPSKSDAEATRM